MCLLIHRTTLVVQPPLLKMLLPLLLLALTPAHHRRLPLRPTVTPPLRWRRRVLLRLLLVQTHLHPPQQFSLHRPSHAPCEHARRFSMTSFYLRRLARGASARLSWCAADVLIQGCRVQRAAWWFARRDARCAAARIMVLHPHCMLRCGRLRHWVVLCLGHPRGLTTPWECSNCAQRRVCTQAFATAVI